MKKLILRPRDWPKAFVDVFDNIFSGGVPFVPPPMLTFRPPSGSSQDDVYLQMMGEQQDSAARMMNAQRAAGAMGGLGGSLLAQLTGYRPYGTKPIALQEGKVSVQVTFKRVDKEHVLVQVECIQRIVHNNKELREVTANLIEEYAEQYLFQAPIKKDAMAPTHEPGTVLTPEAKEVSKK